MLKREINKSLLALMLFALLSTGIGNCVAATLQQRAEALKNEVDTLCANLSGVKDVPQQNIDDLNRLSKESISTNAVKEDTLKSNEDKFNAIRKKVLPVIADHYKTEVGHIKSYAEKLTKNSSDVLFLFWLMDDFTKAVNSKEANSTDILNKYKLIHDMYKAIQKPALAEKYEKLDKTILEIQKIKENVSSLGIYLIIIAVVLFILLVVFLFGFRRILKIIESRIRFFTKGYDRRFNETEQKIREKNSILSETCSANSPNYKNINEKILRLEQRVDTLEIKSSDDQSRKERHTKANLPVTNNTYLTRQESLDKIDNLVRPYLSRNVETVSQVKQYLENTLMNMAARVDMLDATLLPAYASWDIIRITLDSQLDDKILFFVKNGTKARIEFITLFDGIQINGTVDNMIRYAVKNRDGQINKGLVKQKT
ncbi:MAG: hypothetical protein WC091_02170 [Sulfuricellaceae bacterium]